MMSDIEQLKADNDYLVDAIDHIKRVCHSSRTQSRRIRWIASRCESALNGDDEWRALSMPKTVSSDSSRFIAANRQIKLHQDEITRLREENYRLRVKLAVNYAGSALYSDDGELQDGRATPFIDFKRDTLDEIEAKIIERFARSQNEHSRD